MYTFGETSYFRRIDLSTIRVSLHCRTGRSCSAFSRALHPPSEQRSASPFPAAAGSRAVPAEVLLVAKELRPRRIGLPELKGQGLVAVRVELPDQPVVLLGFQRTDPQTLKSAGDASGASDWPWRILEKCRRARRNLL